MPLKLLIRTLVDASLDAACVVNRDLHIQHFNSNYVRLSGLRLRELRQLNLHGLCHRHFGLESCNASGGCVASRAFESGRPVRVDEVRSGDGELRLIVVAVPLINGNGEVEAVLEQYRDVTAESRMQGNYKRLLDFERHQNGILKAEVARQTRQLAELAQTDALTGLVNRRYFDERFTVELARAATREDLLSVVVFDLDRFKSINDTLGHSGGDAVLKRFAEILKETAREADVVARIGGEEFVVLLPATDSRGAEAFFRRVQLRLREPGFPTTTSAGIATYPFGGQSEQDLFDSADKALYAAKTGGRDRVEIADLMAPLLLATGA